MEMIPEDKVLSPMEVIDHRETISSLLEKAMSKMDWGLKLISSKSSSIFFYRCRSSSLPINKAVFNTVVAGESSSFSSSSTSQHHHKIRIFCVFENHQGISNIEISLAACLGVWIKAGESDEPRQNAFGCCC